MVSRRGFIQGSLAVSALVAVPSNGTLRERGSAWLAYFIVDRNLALASRFESYATAAGLPLRTIDSDPGRVWMHEIEPLWRRERVAIAGFTSAATLFCLQLLARDFSMTLGHCAAHSDPAGTSAVFAALADRPSLPAAVCELIDPAGAARDRRGYSWVIAPRTRG